MKQSKKGFRLFNCVSIFLVIVFILLECSSTFAYGDNLFLDVSDEDYFSNAIYTMYDMGAVKGYSNGEFKPYNNVTVAEALTILYRISGMDIDKSEKGDKWYSDVETTAYRMRIIDNKTDMNKFATREEIAKYIISIYKLDITNTVMRNIFTDTNSVFANTMYQYGIFQGAKSDDGYIFMPDNEITRGDLCLVLYRLNTLIPTPYSEEIHIGNYTVHSNPSNREDMMTIMKALGESGELTITVPYYKDLSNNSDYFILRNNLVSAFEESFSKYPEYFSFTPSINFKRELTDIRDGDLVLTIYNLKIEESEILRMRLEFEEKCKNIVKQLYIEGKLTDTMTETEKAKVLFEYVIVNTKYDETYSVNSFTGYGAAIESKAVCQGYTAMYNRLCKEIGLEVEGVAGTIKSTLEEHMWTKVKLDGVWTYCDTTFGDPIPDKEGYCDFTYFNISFEDLMKDRVLEEYSKVA